MRPFSNRWFKLDCEILPVTYSAEGYPDPRPSYPDTGTAMKCSFQPGNTGDTMQQLLDGPRDVQPAGVVAALFMFRTDPGVGVKWGIKFRGKVYVCRGPAIGRAAGASGPNCYGVAADLLS